MQGGRYYRRGTEGYYRGRRGALRGGRGSFRGGMRSDYMNADTVIMPSGEPLPIRQNLPGSMRGPRQNYLTRRGHDSARFRTHSEGKNENGRRDDGVRIPSRPLTRVVARARARSQSGSKSGHPDSSGDVIPEKSSYRMEVNEYIRRPSNDSNDDSDRTIPCVTIRDMHTFINDRKQRRVWVPVAVCDQLVRALRKSKTDETNNLFDVEKLEPTTFTCPITKKVVEIEREANRTRLRTYMDVPPKSEYKDGDLIEVIELRNELMNRLCKFLEDVATRYRKIKSQMTIPSLYSYSGERRFYFDLRDTRWGFRLHISQVTDLHRNVIGIPLETLVEFRDRLNGVLDFLDLHAETRDSKNRGKKSKKGKQRKYRPKAEKKVSREGSPEKTQANGDVADSTAEEVSDSAPRETVTA